MRGRLGKTALAATAILSLAACGGSEQPELMNIRSSASGPDEFVILPTKPLELPEDMAALPEPTPGGSNRTDPSPEVDAIAALGGNPAAVARGRGIPSADGALLSHAGRFGVSGTIREQLAAEDLEYRRQNDGRLLERLFNVTVYFRAYRPLSLDQYAELERWRARGVRTSAAPPDPADE